MSDELMAAAPRAHWSIRLIGALPLRLLHLLGTGLGWLVYGLSPRYRRSLRENMRQAGFESASIRRSAVAEAGRMLAELPWIWCRSPAAVAARVRCDDLDIVLRAEAQHRGILFVTPHLGAFEVAARYYASRRQITVLYRPPKKAWLRPVLVSARSAAGLLAVPTDASGVRALLRSLRRGDAVGLVPDQVPGVGQGHWASFFGRAAFTMTLPERLAEKTGAAVILAVGERLSGGRGWCLHLEQIEAPPSAELLNQRFETQVRRLPGQYLWAYNRYKRPAGAPAAAPDHD